MEEKLGKYRNYSTQVKSVTDSDIALCKARRITPPALARPAFFEP